MTINIRTFRDRLPQEIADLESEARQEGYRHIARLIDEWSTGAVRFDRDGERLLGAYADEVLAGIGGMTVETAMSGVLRMRRFYISPAMRGRGIGRMLAMALLDHASSFCTVVTVHAGNDGAARFWESLGFQSHGRDGHSHLLALQHHNGGPAASDLRQCVTPRSP
ncbi:GNAT family N-acetyltransferase [Rhizobium leguminosarum]|uniref:GNAT family N-acetyltransferase n=1 Tax=Rhizobium leguminosarum TaxID=384 RepID=UPI0010324059|nr:GNAT family N-acetyltransferase [Rhizobium leguminosarum]QIO73813.1 GNAT family N-acetyltransferase [Rhizobium leguminosarum bv. trifolii]QIO80832.1 GNAT family N-acetyltransferase [Rhizobium leguminosarum bv. trifolii]TAU22679.1 GNAT family N-acetyltransferase [Rhizobium leguminosarum]TAU42675.1 GNAT family N-acetyltransferase [Rhizobium leguminosarum]TAV13087.1 GNAT family N-acetyltransferase [Rhizobium leguminosarum]